jgi:hypothetical protein
MYSVGRVQDPAIGYIVAGGGTKPRSLYFVKQFSTMAASVHPLQYPSIKYHRIHHFKLGMAQDILSLPF